MPRVYSNDAPRRAAAECLLEWMLEAGLASIHRVAPAPPLPATTSSAEALSLGLIAAAVASCQNCDLWRNRTTAVPGEGHAAARLMFVGLAPGAEEDRLGRPFVGPAGQLLDKIIENGMKLTRSEVFFSNLVKCRPLHDGAPQEQEVALCSNYLTQQIHAIQPELIIALGLPAAQFLLQTSAPIAAIRGKIHQRPQDGPPILVTDHPASLLLEPSRKAECWADIQVAMRFLGLPA